MLNMFNSLNIIYLIVINLNAQTYIFGILKACYIKNIQHF